MVAFLGSSLLAMPSRASGDDETKVGLRLSVADDVYYYDHARGAILASGRYGDAWGARLGFWVPNPAVKTAVPHVFAGADRLFTTGSWRYGIGIIWIDTETGVNGTKWNFHLSVAYDLSEKYFVEFSHFSHGADFGIEPDAPNSPGWNFLGVGVAF